jgi:hypothetical protein
LELSEFLVAEMVSETEQAWVRWVRYFPAQAMAIAAGLEIRLVDMIDDRLYPECPSMTLGL